MIIDFMSIILIIFIGDFGHCIFKMLPLNIKCETLGGFERNVIFVDIFPTHYL